MVDEVGCWVQVKTSVGVPGLFTHTYLPSKFVIGASLVKRSFEVINML